LIINRNVTVNSSPRPALNNSLMVYPLTGANAYEMELKIEFDFTDNDLPLTYALYYIKE